MAVEQVSMVVAAGCALAAVVACRRLRALRAALDQRHRQDQDLLDAQSWIASMKESSLNIAGALDQAGRLVHFSRNLNILDPEALPGAMRRFLPALFGADHFSVFLYRVHRRQLVLYAHNHTEWGWLREPFVVPAGGGSRIMEDAIATRAPVVVPSFSRSRYASTATLARYPEGPAICAPLLAGPAVLGVLNLNGLRARDINATYLALVRQAADHLALALHDAQLVARLNQQAIRDPLTGLYNRRHFYHAAGRMADLARRRAGRFSLLLLDLDGFKGVNDEHGHAMGDKLLRAVAGEITGALRPTDVPCRIGGDEFVALLEDAGREEAELIADRIAAGVAARRHVSESGTPVHLTVSIGIAEAARDEGCESLLRRADQSLYAAKLARPRGGELPRMRHPLRPAALMSEPAAEA